MNKVTQIDKIQIDAVSSSGTIIKFDYMAHFKVIEFQNETFLALHFSENWAYLSKNRHSLYKTMRAYMLTQGASDGYDSSLSKNAKTIIRKRKNYIKEFCAFLNIRETTDCGEEQLQQIDKLIAMKGSKTVYENYNIHLGVFLGEIINRKNKGKWILKEETGIFLKYNVPCIQINNKEIISPWGLIGKYYDKNTDEFSLFLSFRSIHQKLDIFYLGGNLN